MFSSRISTVKRSSTIKKPLVKAFFTKLAIKLAASKHSSTCQTLSMPPVPAVPTDLIDQIMAMSQIMVIETPPGDTSIVKASNEVTSDQSSTTIVPSKKKDILEAAPHIIEVIPDIVTLTRLSQTCRLFKELVNDRKNLYNKLFDRLEDGTPAMDHVPSCWGTPGCFCNIMRRTLDPSPPNHDSSILVTNITNFDQQRWAPCYGCHKMKTRGEFHINQVTDCYDLHSCRSVYRRCKSCVVENQKAGTECEFDKHGILNIKDQSYRDHEHDRNRRYEALVQKWEAMCATDEDEDPEIIKMASALMRSRLRLRYGLQWF